MYMAFIQLLCSQRRRRQGFWQVTTVHVHVALNRIQLKKRRQATDASLYARVFAAKGDVADD